MDYDCAVMCDAYLITLTLGFFPRRRGLDKTNSGLMLSSGPDDVILISGPDLLDGIARCPQEEGQNIWVSINL